MLQTKLNKDQHVQVTHQLQKQPGFPGCFFIKPQIYPGNPSKILLSNDESCTIRKEAQR